MIALPSRSGRTRARSSCSRDLGDPLLEGVVGRRQRRRPPLVAGRGVRADQLVQPGEQVAGVGDVAADGGVGPLARARTRGTAGAGRSAGRPPRRRPSGTAAPSAACAPASRRPPRGGGRRPGRAARAAGSPACRCRAAARPAAAPGPATRASGIGLLQLDRLVQHGQRVGVDVLVLVVLVDLHPQRGQLGQDDVGQAGGDEQLQRRPRRVLQQGLRQLDLHPLGGDPAPARRTATVIAAHDLVVRRQPELGHEADGAQHPQRVVGEGVDGRARACAAAGPAGRRARRRGR